MESSVSRKQIVGRSRDGKRAGRLPTFSYVNHKLSSVGRHVVLCPARTIVLIDTHGRKIRYIMPDIGVVSLAR